MDLRFFHVEKSKCCYFVNIKLFGRILNSFLCGGTFCEDRVNSCKKRRTNSLGPQKLVLFSFTISRAL
eukprot:TRINITY_DN13706_c0_g1_i1.p3 TRINITY_DN13706_c0_g1~~TRINITY_DN13706_c0_g1_i1.p3  ORF type:complete len:68 (-),score=8.66 TRINITY_DN13706_c0_g1_i1:134-337(-)